MEHIGEAIRYYRGRLRLTQEQLAERARISHGHVVRLESGEIRNPRMGTVQNLEEALGVSGQLLQFIMQPPTMSNPPVESSTRLTSGGVGEFTAVYQRDGEWWVGYIEELPGANAQERTLGEARESLREAVLDVLEANRELTRMEFEGLDVVREPLKV